jgi:hypothetical protein
MTAMDNSVHLASAQTYASQAPTCDSRATCEALQEQQNRRCEFELPGNDAIMRREGGRLIIEPAPPKSLLAVLDKLSSVDEKSPTIGELAALLGTSPRLGWVFRICNPD